MENASLVDKPSEAEGVNRKSHHAKRQTLVRLKFLATTLFLLASIVLIIMMFIALPARIFSVAVPDRICTDNINKVASISFAAAYNETNFENDSTTDQWATVMRLIFQMNPLSITMAWGPLTFPNAKAIDTVWNLVVSRMGQIVFGIVSYRVIITWLIERMRSQSVPYQLVRETASSRGYSIVVLWHLINMKRGFKLWK
ncbi:hypothetical protein BKA67DRAFT_579890 [Truncatella angustata]|uniref:Uncharacterized protein n=1 Tax=Truncatella angustata TaxID=152316 RepID=A0A9P8RI90_9PEZI|nr:uncharacterized protein BKA67DRAFT_579890 [Truncatella angustata]KAH6646524.1 hypothetical protein BKA67DRAFT_579890 [Truncatella angustata]